jgi:hypothetical protein
VGFDGSSFLRLRRAMIHAARVFLSARAQRVSLVRCGFLAVCLNVVRSIVVPRDSKKMFVQLSS